MREEFVNKILIAIVFNYMICEVKAPLKLPLGDVVLCCWGSLYRTQNMLENRTLEDVI